MDDLERELVRADSVWFLDLVPFVSYCFHMPLPNGAAIKAIRQAKGWKGVRLASVVGISHGHLFNIESGRKKASPEVLRDIADTLNVPLAAITSNYSTEQIVGCASTQVA